MVAALKRQQNASWQGERDGRMMGTHMTVEEPSHAA